MTGLIGVVSGLCTIVVTAFAIYAWVRTHALIVRIHDPMKAIRGDSLSIVDVQRAMQRMVKDAQEYQPDHIVGINRGGAIVGGWLAKQLGLEAPIVVIVNSDEPPGRRVTPQLSRNGAPSGRIYLVDDAQRKGEHMREAANYFTSNILVSRSDERYSCR